MQKTADLMPVSNHFPFEVRSRLTAAAQVPVTDADPMARARRINAVMVWARANYPQCFRVQSPADTGGSL